MMRTTLYADPSGRFLHDTVLASCRQFRSKTALFDSSCSRRISYAEYGEIVESLAKGLVVAGLEPGQVVALFLANGWEFCAAYHATTLAGGVPTLLNPSYREREVRYQLFNSGAVFLITDGPLLADMNLAGLPDLRRVFTTRRRHLGSEPFETLLGSASCRLPSPAQGSDQTLAVLPYSSGTTGLPKGVMLSHYNLLANIYQTLGPRASPISDQEVLLCFLPLYHIYGLNVALNPILTIGGTLVLMPRFHLQTLLALLTQENVTAILTVPPALHSLTEAAEARLFPKDHQVHWVKSGAAPLSSQLARRFTAATGIRLCQGYGMTEASPVTHIGFLDAELYKPESIGQPLARTDCRVVDEKTREVTPGEAGELVMRGPQFMLGYWKEPQATSAVMRDGWYWSGDIVTRDAQDFYYVLDRSKDMIKYKGFPIAPAEVEAVLLEHPAVDDCGVVAKLDSSAGEVPCAFVVLRAGTDASDTLKEELCGFVAERLTPYKQPREVRFIDVVPKTLSGKILRRELQKALG